MKWMEVIKANIENKVAISKTTNTEDDIPIHLINTEEQFSSI